MNLRQRFLADRRDDLVESLTLRHGRYADYAALAEFHYRAHRPGTATRVWMLESLRPTVVGRFLHRRDESQRVGVLVESLPSLACRLRQYALHGRYEAFPMGPARARALCQEIRCISRVVVHPQWRGLGLAVRLVRAALAQAATRYTEALAAMGHVHPFFEIAGMTAYRRAPHACDARLADALRSAGLDVRDLAHAARQIESMPAEQRRWMLRELRGWVSRTRRTTKLDWDQLTPRDLLLAARQRLLSDPVYYLKEHR